MAVETARDDTQDWILPPERRPRTFADLEGRIETAVAVARSAEAAALAIGDAAIEAAEQARRAAEMAETAAIRAAEATPAPAATAPIEAAPDSRFHPPTPLPPGDEDDGDHDFAPSRPIAAVAPPSTPSAPDLDARLRAFAERASQVSMRLIALGNPEPRRGESGSLRAVAS